MKNLLILCVSSLALLGCGGSSSTTPTQQITSSSPPPPPPTTTSQGYSHSTPFLNGNGRVFDNAKEISLSADGNILSFISSSSNIVPNDANTKEDVFVYNFSTDRITLASKRNSGNQHFDRINAAKLLPKGFSMFMQAADPQLISSALSFGLKNVHVTNFANPRNTLSYGGALPSPSFSNDESKYVFYSFDQLLSNDFDTKADVIINRGGGNELLVKDTSGSFPNGDTEFPVISGNGQYTIFASSATDIKDSLNQPQSYSRQLFRINNTTGAIERVSVTKDGNLNGFPNIDIDAVFDVSDDGRYIVYSTGAGNVIFDGSTSGFKNVYIYDAVAKDTKLISQDQSGDSLNPSISGDGKKVFFQSKASLTTDSTPPQIYQIYCYDRISGNIELVSKTTSSTGNGHSKNALTNHDGSLVIYTTEASNIIDGDTNGNVDLVVSKK